jgi:hypothetical protein
MYTHKPLVMTKPATAPGLRGVFHTTQKGRGAAWTAEEDIQLIEGWNDARLSNGGADTSFRWDAVAAAVVAAAEAAGGTFLRSAKACKNRMGVLKKLYRLVKQYNGAQGQTGARV